MLPFLIMALFEFYCDACQIKFDQLIRTSDPELGKCPKCQGKDTRKLISRFAVGGQGDLRESTFHGCHDTHVSLPGESSHPHDHSHDHDPGHGGHDNES